MALSLEVLTEEDWRVWRELRLAALAEAPDAFGSTLADWTGAGDTEERWRGRFRGVPFNVVARLEGRAVGVVGGLLTGGTAELISLWVSPEARGQAVGDFLVRSVIDWAVEHGAAALELDVREANAPALTLYRRHGFLDVGPCPDHEPGTPPERRLRLHLASAADCGTCRLVARRDAGEAPEWDAIVRTELWDVVHAFGSSVPGWLVLVLRRHETALADLTEPEAAELGPLVRKVSSALHQATGCVKTYMAQFAEAVDHPHVHVHLVPRDADLLPEHRGPSIFQCLGVPAEECVPEEVMNDIARKLKAALGRP